MQGAKGRRVTDEAFAALADLYERVESETARSAACRRCGACCRFAQFGHRLYCSFLEAAYLRRTAGEPPGVFSASSCGYQSGNECLARRGRTLGCRTFFCAEAGRERRELHEGALGEIRELTHRFGLPWEYRPIEEHFTEPGSCWHTAGRAPGHEGAGG